MQVETVTRLIGSYGTESTEHFKEKLTEKNVVRKKATVLKTDADPSSIVTFPNKSMATWTKAGEHDL